MCRFANSVGAVRLTALVAALVLVVGACGRSESDDADNSGDPVTETSTKTADPTPSVDSFVADRSMSLTVAYSDGSTYDLALELGTPLPASAIEPLEGFPLPDACSIDDDRDLVIPAQVLATSTTQGFDIEMKAAARVAYPNGTTPADGANEPWEAVTVEGSNTYSNGSDCAGAGQTGIQVTNVAFQSAVLGEERSHQFWIIIHDYFTPEYPQGNSAALDGLGIQFSFFDDAGGYAATYDGTGTGVIPFKVLSNNNGADFVYVLPFSDSSVIDREL